MSIATFLEMGRHGELGNQMFQVASVTGYGRKNGKRVVFPDWTCKMSGKNYLKIFKNPVDTKFPTGEILNKPIRNVHYRELKYVEIPHIEENVNFTGYFQSEKFFEHCSEEIKTMFLPNEEIEKYIEDKYADLLSRPNRVSLHVRTAKRANSDSPQVHAAASMEFIEKSMQHFADDSLYVVFADVMEEAKKILPEGKNYFFIEGEENYIDLFLMTRFDSYIVSPSTFGWWGAWLSNSESPKITVLRDWFRKDGSLSHLNENDIIPENWIKIEA
jgi:hypothetical protein